MEATGRPGGANVAPLADPYSKSREPRPLGVITCPKCYAPVKLLARGGNLACHARVWEGGFSGSFRGCSYRTKASVEDLEKFCGKCRHHEWDHRDGECGVCGCAGLAAGKKP